MPCDNKKSVMQPKVHDVLTKDSLMSWYTASTENDEYVTSVDTKHDINRLYLAYQ